MSSYLSMNQKLMEDHHEKSHKEGLHSNECNHWLYSPVLSDIIDLPFSPLIVYGTIPMYIYASADIELAIIALVYVVL